MIKSLLDILATEKMFSWALFLPPIGFFITINFIVNLMWRVANIAQWRAEPFVLRSICLDFYQAVMNHPYKFFQENFVGSIVSKQKAVVDGYFNLATHLRSGVFSRAFTILINLIFLSFVSYKFCLFMLLGNLSFSLFMYFSVPKLDKLAFRSINSWHQIIGLISDKISNMAAIFAYGAKESEYGLLREEISNDYIPKLVDLLKCDFWINLIASFFYKAVYLGMISLAIYLKLSGELSLGDVSLVLALGFAIGDDVWHLTNEVSSFAKLMGEFKNALELLPNEKVSLNLLDSRLLVDLPASALPEIEFTDVTFSYAEQMNDAAVIKNLNLKVSAGEKVGIVGRSGAGKSTLISLLLRLYEVSQGKVAIGGFDIATVSEQSLRKFIGLMPQDSSLFHRSLAENISFGKRFATFDEIEKASERAHIRDYIKGLPEGYGTLVGERGLKLSGGQRQRISIARAILKDAPILILDEATSSLDSQTEADIQESLNFFISDRKKTVIAVAHRLSTLKHMDRIVVLDQGRIVEEGSHESLISNPTSLYKKLWDLQEI